MKSSYISPTYSHFMYFLQKNCIGYICGYGKFNDDRCCEYFYDMYKHLRHENLLAIEEAKQCIARDCEGYGEIPRRFLKTYNYNSCQCVFNAYEPQQQAACWCSHTIHRPVVYINFKCMTS